MLEGQREAGGGPAAVLHRKQDPGMISYVSNGNTTNTNNRKANSHISNHASSNNYSNDNSIVYHMISYVSHLYDTITWTGYIAYTYTMFKLSLIVCTTRIT